MLRGSCGGGCWLVVGGWWLVWSSPGPGPGPGCRGEEKKRGRQARREVLYSQENCV